MMLQANAEETFKFNYRVDIVQRTVENMRTCDSPFEVPVDLFPFPEFLNRQPKVQIR